MKKVFILAAACLFNVANAIAQDTTAVLDVLRAPSSPAASLIGTSPSDVQSFTDPSAFMVSLQNATDNFTTLPKNYAVDIAPAWLFGGKNIKFDDYKSNSFGKTFIQSLMLSAAISNTDDSTGKRTDLGISLKFSIRRGQFSDKQQADLDLANTILKKLLTKKAIEMAKSQKQLDSLRTEANRNANDSTIYKQIMTQISIVGQKIEVGFIAAIEKDKKELDSIKTIISKISFKRYGFKTDFAIGTAFDYPMHVYDSGSLSKAGAWVTVGYDDESGMSIQGIGRYLYNPDKVFADEKGVLKQKDISTFDAGGKLQYENLKYNVTIGGEAVYRSVLNYSDVRPTWRCTFNADYAFKKNTHLTLVIGRDYDGTFNKDGTLITALNFIMGLGNGKRLN